MMQSIVTSLLKKEVKKTPKEPPTVSELIDKLSSAWEATVELAADNRKLRAEVNRLNTSLLTKEAIRMARQCDDPMLAQLMDVNETNSNLSLDNKRLRAEVDRLNKVVQELREKLDRSEVNLQPCPFCGNTESVLLSSVDPEDTCLLYCTKCGAEVDFGVSKEEAVKLWNTRAATPKVVDTEDEYP